MFARRIRALTFGALGWTLALAAVAAEEDGWALVRESDGVEVHARAVANSPVQEVRATIVIEAPPRRVFDVVRDWRQFKDFMPYLVEVREVGRGTADEWTLYQRISTGVWGVSDRDYVLRHRKTEDAQLGRYELRWEAANEMLPEEFSGVVRIRTCNGSYVAEGVDGNARTRLTYSLHADPRLPSAFAWVTDYANRYSVPKLLRAIACRSVDPACRG